MENVLLSTLGADGYRDLWQGKVRWNDSRVREALTIYTKILGYVNRDHAALANMDAAGYVAEGKAAINIMGDWAAGYYYSQGFKQGEDWEWAPAPGTAGIFNVSATLRLPNAQP